MSTAELIVWLANYMYVNNASANKKAAALVADRIVNQLIDKGVVVTTNATPSHRGDAPAVLVPAMDELDRQDHGK